MPGADPKSFSEERTALHMNLAGMLLHYVADDNGQPLLLAGVRITSNADSSNAVSVRIGARFAEKIEAQSGALNVGPKLPGQRYGNHFELVISDFVKRTFSSLGHIRPGRWEVKQVTRRDDRLSIAEYEQYAYLKVIDEFARKDLRLDAALGSDYLVASDVVIARERLTDDEINRDSSGQPFPFVNDKVAKRSRLRASVIADAAAITGEEHSQGTSQLLHASISCKWTIRSDRAQNTRLEARNLSRNRKGNQPHIVAVTAEPLPSRLASVALSTGDIDCVYHIALDELLDAFVSLQEELKTSLLELEQQTAQLRQQAHEIEALEAQARTVRHSKRTLKLNWEQRRSELQDQLESVRDTTVRQQLTDQLQEARRRYDSQHEELRASELSIRERKMQAEAAFEPNRSTYRNVQRQLRDIANQRDQLESEDKWLQKMVQGNRLRDISDLPLDLAV